MILWLWSYNRTQNQTRGPYSQMHGIHVLILSCHQPLRSLFSGKSANSVLQAEAPKMDLNEFDWCTQTLRRTFLLEPQSYLNIVICCDTILNPIDYSSVNTQQQSQVSTKLAAPTATWSTF
jgi:hypothetical protein